jgi:lipopolysaccharide transport system ATP-binding protein
MAIIEVEHVTKEFRLGQLTSLKQTALNAFKRLRGEHVEQRKPFKALDDVHFSIDQGEVAGIIGQNGAGKSTLLKLLARISKPTSGRVIVRGKVAPLIEVGAGLVGDLTGRENTYLNGAILGMKRAEIDRKFDEIVAFAELEQFIDTPIKRFSSGMQVRLGFSIATSVDADILIVDEVLVVGDLAFQRKCFDRIEELIKEHGKTVLLVSHNIRQVEHLCRRALLLEYGRIINDGPAKDVCNNFYSRVDEKIHRQAAKAGHRIHTTGEVELLDVSIRDSHGNRTDSVPYLSEVTIALRIKVLNRLVYPLFVIGIHTAEFIYLTTKTSPQWIRNLTLEPGSYDIICRVPRFPLLPGVYALRVGIDVGDIISNIFYTENTYNFRVVSNELQRTSSDCEGFFALSTIWDLQTATQPIDADGHFISHTEPPGADSTGHYDSRATVENA